MPEKATEGIVDRREQGFVVLERKGDGVMLDLPEELLPDDLQGGDRVVLFAYTDRRPKLKPEE